MQHDHASSTATSSHASTTNAISTALWCTIQASMPTTISSKSRQHQIKKHCPKAMLPDPAKPMCTTNANAYAYAYAYANAYAHGTTTSSDAYAPHASANAVWTGESMCQTTNQARAT